MKFQLSNKMFMFLEIFIFIAMCVSVFFSYFNYDKSSINSAPSYTNLLIAIPFIIIMLILLVFKLVINK